MSELVVVGVVRREDSKDEHLRLYCTGYYMYSRTIPRYTVRAAKVCRSAVRRT